MVHRDTHEYDARNINPFHSYAVATLRVVVTAIALVMLQHGCTFVGVATAVPAVRVGTTAEEHGTQIVV
jgi:hypothetical protein